MSRSILAGHSRVRPATPQAVAATTLVDAVNGL